MAEKSALDYELAEIELDRRQLQLEERKIQLERKELNVKKRLARLHTIELIEEESQESPNTRLSIEQQISTRNASSSDPQPEAPSFTTNTDMTSIDVDEETFVKTEQSTKLAQMEDDTQASEDGRLGVPFLRRLRTNSFLERSSPTADSPQKPAGST